jgi:Lipoprotein LpqB beta-propeller domain/Sporulation and spore germination
MRGGRLVVVCIAVAVAAALSSCGGLPTVSAVQQGSLVGEQAVQPIRVQPDGPAAGATPDQIVRGFIRAGAGSGFDDDYAIARSFFTPNVKDDWQPDSGVEVFGDQTPLKVELLTSTTVRVTASIVAEVDSVGRYRETPVGTLVQATFGMQKLNAGWRISLPQKGFGLWLGSSDLDRIYQPFTIAYVSTATRTIVGDRRWFPITSGLATTLARAQLAPVPSYLNGAVQTGVPTGTALAVDAVPIQSGLAVVDMSGSDLSADPDLRRAMWAQFVTTLMQVPSVTEVSLEVQGARLNLPGTPDRVSLLTTLGYQLDPVFLAKDAILRTGTKLSRVSPDRPKNQDLPPKGSQQPVSPGLPTIPAGWISLALSWDEREIAGIGGDHSELARWQGNRMFQLREFGTDLTKPSFDSLNGLWVAGQVGGTSKVWVIDTSLSPIEKATPRQILVPWLAKRKVVALRVAGDNRRIALVTTNMAGGDVQLVVAGIVRSGNGAAVSLAPEPLRVGWTLTAATDLAWVDDSTLSVVGRVSSKDAMGPQLVEIGGKVTALPPVVGARLVTNSGGPRGVVVMTDGGQVLALAGNGWQQLQTGTEFLISGQ